MNNLCGFLKTFGELGDSVNELNLENSCYFVNMCVCGKDRW